MKRKETLVLIEILIMTVVFALIAAWCLRIFADAQVTADGNADRDRSILEAQNAAQVLISCEGDLAAAASLYGGSVSGTTWTVGYDRNWHITDETPAHILTVSLLPGNALLGQACITIDRADGTQLFTIPAAWQKEVSDEQ